MSDRKSVPERESIHFDAFFQLLCDRRRRTLLAVLADGAGSLTVNDLTKELAAREFDEPITEVSGDEVTELYLSLRHVHVPRLADTPLVEYDESRELLEPTAELDRVAPLLATLDEADSVGALADRV